MTQVCLNIEELYKGILLVQKMLSQAKFNHGGTTLYRRNGVFLSTQDPQVFLEEIAFTNPYHRIVFQILKEESRKLIRKYGFGNVEFVELLASSIKDYLKFNDEQKILDNLQTTRNKVLVLETVEYSSIITNLTDEYKNTTSLDAELLLKGIQSGGEGTSLCIKEGLKTGLEVSHNVGYKVPISYLDASQKDEYVFGKNLEDPLIIIYEGRLTSLKTMEGILNLVGGLARPSFLFCQGMSSACKKFWLTNQHQKIVNLIVSYIPGDVWSDHPVIKDMLAVFGGVSIHPLIHPEDITQVDLDLGACLRVFVKGDEAVFMWDQEDEQIQERVLGQIEKLEQVKALASRASSLDECTTRISNLSGDLLTLSVKGITDSETRFLISQTEMLVSYLYSILQGDILTPSWRDCFSNMPVFCNKHFTKQQVLEIIAVAESTFTVLANTGVVLCL